MQASSLPSPSKRGVPVLASPSVQYGARKSWGCPWPLLVIWACPVSIVTAASIIDWAMLSWDSVIRFTSSPEAVPRDQK